MDHILVLDKGEVRAFGEKSKVLTRTVAPPAQAARATAVPPKEIKKA